jgi:putative spermidine/putrescine transport system ATP-binding protein
LGALDLKLREQMQIELKAIQRRVGITFVYVTHDQGEALSMSDRIAVFNQGRIEQIGSATEIYEHPASAFVAGFVGVSNLVSADAAAAITGSRSTFSIRPEKIRIERPDAPLPDGYCGVGGRIESVLYLGASTRYSVALDQGGELAVVDQNREDQTGVELRRLGAPVKLVWARSHIRTIGGGGAEAAR